MSFSYDRYDRRQSSNRRTTFGYWVPLVLTVTVATAGFAAWVWSERRDDDDSSDDADLSYGEDADGKRPAGARDTQSEGATHEESLMARVHGVVRRTPSPQQLFDTVSKKTAAGVAAAGAAVGGVLASIREEDKDDFGDHSRWSEEAALRRNVAAQSSQSASAADAQSRSFAASVRGGPQAGVRRKTVAIVVSAESTMDNPHDDDGSYRSENATILSHLPDTDFNKTRLFVLIYSPSLRSRPNSRTGAASLGSSYSAISTPAHTPGEELTSMAPHPEDTIYTPAMSARSSDNHLWNTLHAQALRLVENPAMVMPFTTLTGHIHMLKHLGPDLVYMVDALSGMNGANVEDIKRWVGQTIVVVGSDGTGLGGLVDTDDEGPASKPKSEHDHGHGSRWWESADMVGLGKGVEVVDAVRLADDFERRAVGRD
ncbi:uncharacterized protein BDR25DRAFT_293701 [Lindgomyces ingoldianus]|uniref:Uncharacterized protein n=1 Tax=Lindgomyces ingoldianus TaxID=673940 RepID=A0ACB6QH39_9PLEO|nr:uncharacterized protein BDR25DRAFT_293701 [Lindgomyces ingoldianus]KAF2466303.1 hypothetical protein BDR25DRAFT_293701 [Lindgomyces ingoldianus]